MKKQSQHLILLFVIGFLSVVLTSCSEKEQPIKAIYSLNDFKEVVTGSDNKLLVVDVYSDGCSPCLVVAPILRSLAKEYKGTVSFYKVDIEKNQNIAAMLNVKLLPTVLFIKNKEVMQVLTGVQQKDTFVKVIEKYSVSY